MVLSASAIVLTGCHIVSYPGCGMFPRMIQVCGGFSCGNTTRSTITKPQKHGELHPPLTVVECKPGGRLFGCSCHVTFERELSNGS